MQRNRSRTVSAVHSFFMSFSFLSERNHESGLSLPDISYRVVNGMSAGFHPALLRIGIAAEYQGP